MCSRHRPENGADSETADARDGTCDYCGRRIYDDSLRIESIGGSVAMICGACRERARDRYAAMVGDA